MRILRPARQLLATCPGGPAEPVQGARGVIFNIYSGGAHCCSYSLIFQYRNGRYTPTQQFSRGNGYYRLRSLRGMRVFVSRDDRFAYRFDCYASSYPLSMWRLTGRGMVDITRRFRGLIKRDANRHKRVWRIRARNGDAAGAPLAAWLADQCMLGTVGGWQTVDRVTRNGGVSASTAVVVRVISRNSAGPSVSSATPAEHSLHRLRGGDAGPARPEGARSAARVLGRDPLPRLKDGASTGG